MFGKKKAAVKLRVLFVDEKNDMTSQMAEHYARNIYGNKYEVYSAGPEHDFIDCDVVGVMYQEGEDIRQQISKDFRNQDDLPADAVFDYVIYLRQNVFDEWKSKTPWQGKQIVAEMGSRADFQATDDRELADCIIATMAKVKDWVTENMKDEENLKSLVSA